jgi:uncharacterized protein with HEPN domain
MGSTQERLQVALEAVDALERNIAGRTFQDYVSAPDLAACVERYLERLSAVLGHLPRSLQEKHAEVDWHAVGEVGNLLHHIYDRDLDRHVWGMATGHLPKLKRALLAMMQDTSSAPRN